VPPAGDGGVSRGLEGDAAGRPVTPEELARVIEQFGARYAAELAGLRDGLGGRADAAEREQAAPAARPGELDQARAEPASASGPAPGARDANAAPARWADAGAAAGDAATPTVQLPPPAAPTAPPRASPPRRRDHAGPTLRWGDVPGRDVRAAWAAARYALWSRPLLLAVVVLLALAVGVGALLLLQRAAGSVAAPPTRAARAPTVAALAAPVVASPATAGGAAAGTAVGTAAAPSPPPTASPAPPATAASPSGGGQASPAPSRPASVAALREQAARAEAALRTGELEATIEYGNGARAALVLRFDLRDERAPRLHLTTSGGEAGAQPLEVVLIGDRAWQRQPGGHWAPTAAREGLLDQLQALLPHAASAANAEAVPAADGAALRWDDAARNAEVTLQVDPAAGVPRQLRLVGRPSGARVTVIYRGWNTPVDIAPPATP
jgi:hypothetical protein